MSSPLLGDVVWAVTDDPKYLPNSVENSDLDLDRPVDGLPAPLTLQLPVIVGGEPVSVRLPLSKGDGPITVGDLLSVIYHFYNKTNISDVPELVELIDQPELVRRMRDSLFVPVIELLSTRERNFLYFGGLEVEGGAVVVGLKTFDGDKL